MKNPKEEGLAKVILTNYDRIEILQAEKVALSEKAMIVVRFVPFFSYSQDASLAKTFEQLDRQIKRYDLKMRKLEQAGEIAPDPSLPSLLQSSAGTGTPITGTPTPQNALSINTAQAGGAPNIANAAMARMAAANSTRSSPISAPNPLLNQPHLNASAARSQRESSADAAKRRRLNTSLSGNIPTQSSALRQSSLGPSSGTPKAGTPVPASSRAGSAQPARPSTTKKAPISKKVAPHQAAASRKRIRTSASGLKKGDRKRNLTSPTPSSSRGSASPTPSSLPQVDGASEIARSRRRGQATSAASDDEAEEPDADQEGDEIYCTW